jgi:hypothetical protein
MRQVLVPAALLLALVGGGCQGRPVQAATAAPAGIDPWEPVDPQFKGCEGG